jgi:hypothetical protein
MVVCDALQIDYADNVPTVTKQRHVVCSRKQESLAKHRPMTQAFAIVVRMPQQGFEQIT